MRDGYQKKSKLSWSKNLVRKWFNIKSKAEDFHADDVCYGGGDGEWRNSFSERESCTIKKSKTERLDRRNVERVRRASVDFEPAQVIDIHNYKIFVATWNVGGKSPPSYLSLEDWLHTSPPADIYVLGFQEIVPLNAGNVLGAEDNGPAKKWLALIRKTLNNLPGSSGSGSCYTPSPIPDPVVELDADFEGSTRQKTSAFFHRRSFQSARSMRMEPKLDRRYSVCDRVIFGNRPSDYIGSRPSDYTGSRPSDYTGSRPSDYTGSRPSDYAGNRPSDYAGNRPSDYAGSRHSDYVGNRPSDYVGNRPSDFGPSYRWGSSEDDYCPGDSPNMPYLSPSSYGYGGSAMDERERPAGRSRYCLVASKQMVGIFLTVWVRGEIKDDVRNMKVSSVGRGLMGYLGNKGSIAISMSLHQTSFCFVCTHLTSGQKEGDELRRNSDVMEILRKTRFPRVQGDDKSPETILEHDRIIWLGDLNYRIALSYRSAKALVQMQNWRALLENDQLRLEQRRGHVFDGWNEGKIYFPPTYKYSYNSDRYAGEDMHSREKRRTPAWCDRILWYGGGIQQLSYVRGESTLSDHRPVYSFFTAEVHSINRSRVKRSTSYSSSRVEIEELLPHPYGYTELNFF
ncbi:type I inositol polyphosphate 5-phosphatase 4-like [Papaver somniferum]|uniref:type I inositol polyphosphate 5-phosphatase 4-like n=1 Tax=Papaver somniferum TaxID=3469 RepID=UPI000E6F81D6|nr:type I inositol polyphosphate 5-phosphatase 4-like [Papaver somniferum]XP_026435651.1 type I inositol polyphosphate 5-phosphatase 4-like [Papaver somniferum]